MLAQVQSMDRLADDDVELLSGRPGPLCSENCIDTIYEDGSWDTFTNLYDEHGLLTLAGSAEPLDTEVFQGGMMLLHHWGSHQFVRVLGGGA